MQRNEISDLEDRIMEITQAGTQTENQVKKKKKERNIRVLLDNIEWDKLYITGIPREEKKEKGIENIFEEITAENHPNLKETDIKIQEKQEHQKYPG